MTRPLVGCSVPETNPSRVDLPAPFTPRMPVRSPGAMRQVTSRSTDRSPNATDTPSRSTTSFPSRCIAIALSETNVELTTAPDANGATHWGQQAFYLQPTLSATDGSVIKGRLELKRKQENQRLYDLRVTWKQGEDEGGSFAPNQDAGERMNVWHIE